MDKDGFDFLKPGEAYIDAAANKLYQFLFCDDLSLYHTGGPYAYPFDILFSETPSLASLQKITEDSEVGSRIKLLAYKRQMALGHQPEKKELLGVIVEVGLDEGLDVLAAYKDGTARYINQSGKIVIWEVANHSSTELTEALFQRSQAIVGHIGPWDQPRKYPPTYGNARISFLVSDGLYFGEAPTNVLFNDPLARPALMAAMDLMNYLMERSLETRPWQR